MRLVIASLVALVAACRPPGYGRDDRPDAASTGDGATGGADAAIDSAAACDHAFRLDGHATASSVWLTGDFVGWADSPQGGAIAMVQGNDGAWTGSYAFPPGTHQYKFIVNGNQWIADPTNPDGVDDGFGGRNSLYTCVP